jgi:hypothetical protein
MFVNEKGEVIFVFEDYFSSSSVRQLIKELETNPRYYLKSIHNHSEYGKNIKNNLGLYIFYDALYKYKVIIDNSSSLDDYIEQIDRLYRKMASFDDIMMGIHKILCKYVSSVLEIKNLNSEDSKLEILSYIYQKFIIDGYYLHGFPTINESDILINGFSSKRYEGHYSQMMRIDAIFRNHDIYNVFKRNFKDSTCYFTDDFVMGCYYSTVAPSYLCSLLTDSHFCKRDRLQDYIAGNYQSMFVDLKKFVSTNFNKQEAHFISKIIHNECRYLNKVPKKISILFVPRKLFPINQSRVEDFYHKGKDIYQMVDNMLSSKAKNISFAGNIIPADIQLFSAPFSVKKPFIEMESSLSEKDLEKVGGKQSIFGLKRLDTYGVISIFIVMGSMLITLGIIISIIMIAGGI